MRAARSVVLGLAASTSACSLVWSTSDFTTGDSAGPADAAALLPDGAPAPAPEGGGASDAGADGSKATASFCTGLTRVPAYCADFEPSTPTTASPGTFFTNGAPPPTVEPSGGASGAGLFFQLAQTGQSAVSRVEWRGSFAPYARFEVALAVRLTSDPLSYTQVLAFSFSGPGGLFHRILFAQNGSNIDVIQEVEGGTKGGGQVPGLRVLLASSDFARITLTGECQTGAITYGVAGKEQKSATLPVPPGGPCTSSLLQYGAYFNGPSQKAKQVRVDEAAVWLE